MSELTPASSESAQPATSPTPRPPKAAVARERRWSWAWLAPMAAAVFIAVMSYRAWHERGPRIVIHFEQGHGLKPGDVLRYRGVVVGEVQDVGVATDLAAVDVAVELHSEAAHLARGGSRFWIVRPRIDLQAVEGLETIVGPHYLTVLPGDGPPQSEFAGHEDPPVAEKIEPGGLEIVLQAPQRGGLRPGAAVYFRQFRVGTVLSARLAADGSVVESRAYIRPPFRELVREQSRFWDVGGLELNGGWLSGLSIEVASAEDLLRGGVAFATPPDGGDVVIDGHRFNVAARAVDEWRAWSPSIPLGGSALPTQDQPPQPLRAVLTWKHDGSLWNSQRRREGYVLRVAEGYLGPADLVTVPESSFADSVQVAIAGKLHAVENSTLALPNGLAILKAAQNAAPTQSVWPAARIRNPGAPEDCVAVLDPTTEQRTIAAARCADEQGVWRIDPVVPLDAAWHGAPAIATSDGKLIGFVQWLEDHAVIAPIGRQR